MKKQYHVKKTLNNNCMIVDESGKEKLLIGKGIAFGKKSGDICGVLPQIEKVFVIEEEKNVADFQQLLHRNDEEFIVFCEELIQELSQKVQTELNERIHVSLIDHISCTLHRLKMGESILNPFLQEIEVLYEKEVLLSEELCQKVAEKYSIEIPRGEVGFVALHIHSAMYNGQIREALRSNRICNGAVSLLEKELHAPIDRKSFDCARFMVHLTYMMKRQIGKEQKENDIAKIILDRYPQSYERAKKVAKLLEKELKTEEISLDELAFLTTHIERLTRSIEEKNQ